MPRGALHGVFTPQCDFTWSTGTSWCHNGSSAYCTHANVRDGLADYGLETNLLECVPTYTHKVASLNAANAHMMRSTALLLKGLGNSTRASELQTSADQISNLVRHKLYV